jgi:hypothetical protein
LARNRRHLSDLDYWLFQAYGYNLRQKENTGRRTHDAAHTQCMILSGFANPEKETGEYCDCGKLFKKCK